MAWVFGLVWFIVGVFVGVRYHELIIAQYKLIYGKKAETSDEAKDE